MTNEAAPRPRWHDLTAVFTDFAITSFDVEPAALTRHLPPDLVPDRRRLPDGRERAFVSAVSFRVLGMTPAWIPGAGFAYAQVNTRAYVLGPEGRAVWFFAMEVGSRALAWAGRGAGLPCRCRAIDVQAEWRNGRCLSYRLDAGSGATALEVVEATGPGDDADAARWFADPLVGYAPHGARRVRVTVAHRPITLSAARVRTARFPELEQRDLVAPGQAPHSIWIAPRVDFVVHLPPRGGR
jgi:uncharacterized protein YqjF (DUF2071 family)